MLYWVEFYFMPRTKAKINYSSGGSRGRAPGIALPLIIWVKKFAEKEMPARQAKNRAREEPLYSVWVKKSQSKENPEGQANQHRASLAQRVEPITWGLKVKRKCG